MPETEVAFAPTRLRGRRRRLPPVLVGLSLVALLVLAVAKPWGSATGPAATPGTSAAAVVVASGAPAGSPSSSVGPAPASGPALASPDPTITAQIVRDLATRSGAWGVGTGGNGPRLIREEPWTDWATVDPGPAWNGTSLTLWPDTGLCLGAPALLSHPSLLAITVPPGLVPDWTVSTWWQDGTGIRSLAGLVRQISLPGNRGIAYLERLDHGPWPVGRYEFDILAGVHRMSLTACIGTA